VRFCKCVIWYEIIHVVCREIFVVGNLSTLLQTFSSLVMKGKRIERSFVCFANEVVLFSLIKIKRYLFIQIDIVYHLT